MAADAWDVIGWITACRLMEVPRRPIPDDPRAEPGHDEWRDQRLAALVSAYHAGEGPVALGWRRAHPAGPVDVFVGGQPLITSNETGAAVLSLPAGGRGQMLPAGALIEAMRAMPFWARIGAITDGLLAAPRSTARTHQQQEPARPSLEDCLLSVWTGPFAWLLTAEPISADEALTLADQTADKQYHSASMAEMSPRDALQAARLEDRHRELRQGTATGLWRIHLLAGGESPQAAARIAALLCASADLGQMPYALTPEGRTGLDSGFTAKGDEGAPAWPFDAGSELVAALARPPAREVAGVRFAVRPEFDVTPETPPGGSGVTLGTILDRNRNPAGILGLPFTSLNRHTFVCGATGAGKSQTVRGLLASATRAGLPWLVIEPAKAEYRLMAARLPGTGVIAIRPGDVEAIPAGINPLEPAPGFPLQTHADLVRALFLAAFESDEPFPQVLSAALTRCYEDLGWDLALGEPVTPGVTPRYPTLGDLQAMAERVVEEIGYSQEITDNVRGFIKVRLSSLRLGTTGRFFEGGHPIDFGQLLARNVVFEIEDVGDDRDKAFLMGTVLVRLTEFLRMRHRRQGVIDPGLLHLAVFEEAHRLLRATEDTGPAAHAVEMFAGLLAEIRAYGEGLIVAEQIPSKLVPDVIKNTAVKIVHRLPAKDDRDAVGATMNITGPQSQYLVSLNPGEGAVFTDGMDYPCLAQMPDGTAAENQPAPVATPAGLVTPRSGTCGTDCRTSPCTLRDMRTAQRTLDDQPALVLWAELAAVAHLTGWDSPLPDGYLAAELETMPQRLRDCAISHAADNAVAARATVIARRCDPAALAAHLAALMRAALDHDDICADEEPAYLATPFQWSLLEDALSAIGGQDPAGGRHPRSGEWETRYGRRIPGETAAAQLEHVTRWRERDQRDKTALRTAVWGAATPSAIETAAGARREDDDWEDRLRAACTGLAGTADLLGYFAATGPESRRDLEPPA